MENARMRAGLQVRRGGNLLDGTLHGLLADRNAVLLTVVDDQQPVAVQAAQFVVEAVRCWACSRRSTHCWAVANSVRWPAWQALIANAVATCVFPVPGE